MIAGLISISIAASDPASYSTKRLNPSQTYNRKSTIVNAQNILSEEAQRFSMEVRGIKEGKGKATKVMAQTGKRQVGIKTAADTKSPLRVVAKKLNYVMRKHYPKPVESLSTRNNPTARTQSTTAKTRTQATDSSNSNSGNNVNGSVQVSGNTGGINWNIQMPFGACASGSTSSK